MQIEGWLSGGDLRSDGDSDEVVKFVLANRGALQDLVAALESKDGVVRGRAADALEKIGRSQPEHFDPYVETICEILKSDDVPMVRWHLAMLLGHLSVLESRRDQIEDVLMEKLADNSVFVVSWVITSLAILVLLEVDKQARIVQAIVPFEQTDSAALRNRARKAITALTHPDQALPTSWVKSPKVKELLASRNSAER